MQRSARWCRFSRERRTKRTAERGKEVKQEQEDAVQTGCSLVAMVTLTRANTGIKENHAR